MRPDAKRPGCPKTTPADLRTNARAHAPRQTTRHISRRRGLRLASMFRYSYRSSAPISIEHARTPPHASSSIYTTRPREKKKHSSEASPCAYKHNQRAKFQRNRDMGRETGSANARTASNARPLTMLAEKSPYAASVVAIKRYAEDHRPSIFSSKSSE